MPSSNVGSVVWDIKESVATVTLNRPEARNALTWEMYDALVEACDRADADPAVRVFIIRGAGGAFAAGTDISQFKDFDGDAGVAYERRLEAVIERVENMRPVTIAAVDGPAVGGGFMLAIACDIRLCSSRASFGIPVSRTLGNCMSIRNLARTIDIVGVPTTYLMLLGGQVLEAAQAQQSGLMTGNIMFTAEQLDDIVAKTAVDMSKRAQSTIAATKATLQRLREQRLPPAGWDDDIIRECYSSAEFKEGVRAFLEGRKPTFP